jgi:hypothetical protein
MASHGYRKVFTMKMKMSDQPKSVYLEDWWVDKSSDVTQQDVQDMIETCVGTPA